MALDNAKLYANLELSEEKFKGVFNSMVDVFSRADLDGNCLLISPSVFNVIGYVPEEIMGRNYAEFYTHPKDWELLNKRLLETGSIQSYESDVNRKDGSRIIISSNAKVIQDDSGQPVYIESVFRDITERKRREKELKNSEEKHRSLLENIPDVVWTSDNKGQTLFISPKIKELYGYSPEEIYEQSEKLWFKKIHPDDVEKVKRAFESLFDKKGFQYDIEYRIKKKDGQWIWVHDKSATTYKKGGVNYADGIMIDITDRKLSEIKLQEAYNKIEQLQMQLQAESAYLQEEIKLEHNFADIIGQSQTLKYVLQRVEMVAPQDSTVILLGETGTGKELIARALHQLSSRSKRPLVKVNCAALPAELIESELFGREKGAFTGATTTQVGRFELANKSTLFLDEIGELPFELQAKLLRVLESGEFERLGSPRMLHSDARIITATNRDLEEEVRNKRFREDLWYRLKIFPITIPPLRDRTEDIPWLVDHFVQLLSRKMGKKAAALTITKSSMQALQSYSWPGNVRELRHIVESALITSEKNKLHFDLPNIADAATRKLKSFEEMEREYILDVLKAKNWKIKGKDSASSILGLPPSTLQSRIKKLGLKRP
jgi:formate hydrogenlyase transcriptional activator